MHMTGVGTREQAARFRVVREQQSLRELTVRSIRRAILSLHYKPGERLTERELCSLTGVSRSVMREALRDLEAQSLVEIVPHRGPAVATLAAKDAEEIYQVRRALEPLAARLFVQNATAEDIAELAKRGANCRTAMRAGDVYESVEALEAFYRHISDVAGNKLAASLGRIVYAKAGLLRAITFKKQSDREARESVRRIEEITDALSKRRESDAISACLKQIERSASVAGRIL